MNMYMKNCRKNKYVMVLHYILWVGTNGNMRSASYIYMFAGHG